MMGEVFNPEIRTYDISFDQKRRIDLKSLPIEEQQRQKEQLFSYVSSQMETHLGERFNISVSEYEYDIKNGEIWGKDMDEPFLKSLKRGRDYRKVHGQEVDKRREEAEVTGFSKIEKLLTDEDTPTGTMMLSISPPGLEGSTYAHNFYDVFTLAERENGEKYIKANRFASSLSPEEYRDKISAFAKLDIDSEDVSASFLEQPIPVQNTLTSQDLHNYLQKEHGFMEKEEFARLLNGCRAAIDGYARAIIEQPENDYLHKTLFNTVLNKADALLAREEEPEEFYRPTLKDDVAKYSGRPVREVMTGCGFSGGYEVSKEIMNSPFSVSSYGKDKYGERTFKCPSCNKENIRPYNTLLPACQHCKSTKVAC
jgi:hypothetical protein